MNDGELIKRIMGKTGESVHVAMPAKIESYDPLRSIADVLIAIPQKRSDDTTVNTPIITEVPVLWPRAGAASITFPLKRGDYGLVVFCDYDIGNWAVELDESTPQSLRRHNLTDAVFIPQTHGLQPSSTLGISVKNGINEALITPLSITLTQGANTITMTDAGVTITSSAIALTGNVVLTGNLVVSGTLTTAGDDFATHTHSGVQTGAGNTGGVN